MGAIGCFAKVEFAIGGMAIGGSDEADPVAGRVASGLAGEARMVGEISTSMLITMSSRHPLRPDRTKGTAGMRLTHARSMHRATRFMPRDPP